MNNNIKGWMIGGLVAVSALGLAFGTTALGSAAAQSTEPVASSPKIMQNGHMAGTGPDMMKNSPDMQKQCEVMMKDADPNRTGAAVQSGKAAMGSDMMNSPDMQQQCQTMMKETGETSNKKTPANDTTASGAVDHNAHHSS